MRKGKVLWALVLMVSVLLGACNRSKSSAEGSADGKKQYRIAVSFMSLNNPFWVAENKTLKEEIEKRGDRLVTYDAQLDMARQISQIEDAIASGVDLVLVSPLDWKGIRPALEACNKKNIPVLNIDTEVFDADLVLTEVVSDHEHGGRLCGEALVQALNGKGDVAVIDLSTNMAVQARMRGFLEVISKYPDIRIVAQQDGDGSVEAALPIMENMMQAHPVINAVFGTNDPAAIGALAALESGGRLKNTFVIGIDGSKDACAFIKEGKMLGTAAQYPSNIAKETVNQAYKVLSGGSVDNERILIAQEWIDSSNVDKYILENSY